MKSDGKKKANDAVSPALKQEFRNLGTLIEDNNHKLSAVAEQVGSLMVTVDVIKSDVEIIKNNLKRKVDLEDFEALTHRVSVLEKRVLR